MLRYALAQEQGIIGHYGQLVERTRGRDVLTEGLLVSILADKVAREGDIESALPDAVVTT